MVSALLRLADDNSLVNGDGKTVVLKGTALGGISIEVVRANSRMDEYGEFHYRVPFSGVSNS